MPFFGVLTPGQEAGYALIAVNKDYFMEGAEPSYAVADLGGSSSQFAMLEPRGYCPSKTVRDEVFFNFTLKGGVRRFLAGSYPVGMTDALKNFNETCKKE